MRKKVWIVVVVLAVVLTMVGIAVSADDGHDHAGRAKRINWRIAGPIVNGVQVLTDPMTGEIGSFGLIALSAKGAPGEAQIQVVGTSQPVPVSDQCPEGTVLQLKFAGGFVATFPDLSMLFFVVDDAPDAKNALCFDYQGPATGVFDYVITGGTGRFESATGSAVVGVRSWGISTGLAAEEGEIVGTIELP